MHRWKAVSDRLWRLKRTPDFEDFEDKVARAIIATVGQVLDHSGGDQHLAVWCFRQVLDDVVKILDDDGGSEADAMAAAKAPVEALIQRARTVWPTAEQQRSIRRGIPRWNEDKRWKNKVIPGRECLLWEARRVKIPGPDWSDGKGGWHNTLDSGGKPYTR
jgi:hypothetical protein